jgi:hypothetical protein
MLIGIRFVQEGMRVILARIETSSNGRNLYAAYTPAHLESVQLDPGVTLMDVIFLAALAGLFALTLGLLAVCDRLFQPRKDQS